MCFRKSFFEEFGLYDEQYILIEDIPMMEKLVSNDIPIGIIDECVIIHRLNSGISSTKRLFKQSNINYYRDNQRIFFDYLQKEKNIFWKIIYNEYYLVSKYRIFMASNSSKKQHLLVTLLYLPVLIIYSFINYKNFLNKLNDFLRSL
ncbi:hypothetical protein SDC9_153423 [bioreactor metagenome]|uniref:Uncharacterized protein n=1 Tax=bioreactor metagenome TaxID=1076179 RepID=A0A645EWB5_9ZZZZ